MCSRGRNRLARPGINCLGPWSPSVLVNYVSIRVRGCTPSGRNWLHDSYRVDLPICSALTAGIEMARDVPLRVHNILGACSTARNRDCDALPGHNEVDALCIFTAQRAACCDPCDLPSQVGRAAFVDGSVRVNLVPNPVRTAERNRIPEPCCETCRGI
jgi:hypothetical protein